MDINLGATREGAGLTSWQAGAQPAAPLPL